MGSSMSTLVYDVLEDLSRETMIGFLLTIPFFVQYFRKHMDDFKHDPTQILSSLQRVLTSQDEHDETDEKVVKHKSLMVGTMPCFDDSQMKTTTTSIAHTDPIHYSDDSVSTVPISNHKKLHTPPATPTCPLPPSQVETVPSSRPMSPLMGGPTDADFDHYKECMTSEAELEPIPMLDVEPDESLPCAPAPANPNSSTFSPEFQPAPRSEAEVSATVTIAEASEEIHSIVTPSRKFPVASVTVLTPDTEPEEDIDFDEVHTLEDSESSAAHRTSDYLESVSRSLFKRACRASHSDKVGIAQALVELGGILLQEKSYKAAMHVYKRAEIIQKAIVDETIASVAEAMAQQSQYYTKNDNASLAGLYGKMAKELDKRPTPTNLTKCMNLHHEHKPHGPMTEEFASLVRKLDRRLKRAGTEAVPLVATLKKQAKVAKAGGLK